MRSLSIKPRPREHDREKFYRPVCISELIFRDVVLPLSRCSLYHGCVSLDNSNVSFPSLLEIFDIHTLILWQPGFHPCRFLLRLLAAGAVKSTSAPDRLLIILSGEAAEAGVLMGWLLIITPSNFCLPFWLTPIMLKAKLPSWHKMTFTFIVDRLQVLLCAPTFSKSTKTIDFVKVINLPDCGCRWVRRGQSRTMTGWLLVSSITHGHLS